MPVDKKAKNSDMVAYELKQPDSRLPLEYAEAFLRDQIPLALRSFVPSTLKTAYDAANVLITDEAILNVNSATDNRGRIVQWAVDLGFQRLCESGQWSFDFRWSYFEKPTGRYLEILPSHSVITISQVSDPKRQPRDVLFRENKRLNSQKWLDGFEPDDQQNNSGVPHILLVHGYQSLDFAHLGIPREFQNEGYHYRTGNLMQIPHAVVGPEHLVEDTDIEAVMTLKEEIDRWRKDHAS